MLRRGLIRLDHRNGDEFSGIKRVFKVLAGVDGETLRKIDNVHDHKGTLVVVWANKPDSNDMARIESAWAEEFEILLEYTFPDGSQFEVQTGATVRQPL